MSVVACASHISLASMSIILWTLRWWKICASWLLTFPKHFQILEDFQRDTQNEFERVKIFVSLWCRADENWYVSHASVNASRLAGVYQYNKRFLLVMVFTSTSATDSHLKNGPIDYWSCNEHRCLMRRKMFLPSLVSTVIKACIEQFRCYMINSLEKDKEGENDF